MKTLFGLSFPLLLAAVGCSGASAPAAGVFWTSTAKSFSLHRVQPGNGGLSPLCQERFTYDATTRALHAETCAQGSAAVSDRTLGAADGASVVTVLDALEPDNAPSQIQPCVVGAGSIDLTINDATGAHTYFSDGCGPRPSPTILAADLAALAAKLEALASPAPGATRALTLTTHFANVPHPKGNACSGETFSYAGHTLTADLCDLGSKLPQTKKDLAAADDAAVQQLIGALAVSSRPTCVEDAEKYDVTLDRGAGAETYVDENDVCNGATTKALTVAPLEALVAKLRALGS